MKIRITAFALLAALFSAFAFAPASTSAATQDQNFLKNLPVSGTLDNGGTFDGTLTITKLGYNQVGGLTVDGIVEGVARDANGAVIGNTSEPFSTAATLNKAASASNITAQATCDVLFLDLGPLNLDVLGLTVDLSQIVLDINAVSGAGNLLGNLLCSVAGLLDGAGFLTDLINGLTQLTQLLDAINDLLS